MATIIICKCEAQLILEKLTPLVDGNEVSIICDNCATIIKLPSKLANRVINPSMKERG
jgi:hypothetical protein